MLKQLVQLLEGGQVRNEFVQELLTKMGETREAASAAIAGVESEPEKRVSFAEAIKFLDGSLDLEAAQTDAVKSHGRWGLVDALIQKGAAELADAKTRLEKDPDNSDLKEWVARLEESIIKTPAQYSAIFDKATIREADLHKVREMGERGEKVLPIFDAGEMTPDELFAVLFTEGGVPHTDSDGFNNLGKLRKIDPNDIPNLANLAEKSDEEQLAAFKAAYKKANPLKPTGVRVIFTPDQQEVTRTNTSATQDMQTFAKGEMAFVDPNADMIRYRTQMDKGLCKIIGRRDNFDGINNSNYRAILDEAFDDETIDKYMPDCKKATRYPNYAFENGSCLSFFFSLMHRSLHIAYCEPNTHGNKVGSRLSFG